MHNGEDTDHFGRKHIRSHTEHWHEFVNELHARLVCVGYTPAQMCGGDFRHAVAMIEYLAASKGVIIDIDGSIAVMRARGGACDCKILDIGAVPAS